MTYVKYLITAASAFVLFFLVKLVMGLRVSEDEEIEGLDYGEHEMHAYDMSPAVSAAPSVSASAANAT